MVKKYTVVIVAENSFKTAHCNCSDAYHAWTGTVNRPISTLTQLKLSVKQDIQGFWLKKYTIFHETFNWV